MVDHDKQPLPLEHSPLDTLLLESIEHLFERAEKLGDQNDREKLTAQIVLIETFRRSANCITQREHPTLPENIFHYLTKCDHTRLLALLSTLRFTCPLQELDIQNFDSRISPHFQLALLRDWSISVAESRGWYSEVGQMIDKKYDLASDAARQVIQDLSAFCAKELNEALLRDSTALWDATILAYANIKRWLPEMLDEADRTT